jgi:hypothetical protein
MIRLLHSAPLAAESRLGEQRNLQVEILGGICNSDFGEILTKGEYLPLHKH